MQNSLDLKIKVEADQSKYGLAEDVMERLRSDDTELFKQKYENELIEEEKAAIDRTVDLPRKVYKRIIEDKYEEIKVKNLILEMICVV